MDIEALGLITGHTVTKSVFSACQKAKLPESAMAQIWPKRTLTPKAIEAIKLAVADTAKPKGQDKKESEAK
jgi:hypothetical protein